MKSKMNWEMLAFHVREAKGSLDSLHEFLEVKAGRREQKEGDENFFLKHDASEGRLRAELAHVYHHLNFGWNTRHMDAAVAEAAFDLNEKWPLEFDQFFRDYDEIDEPIIEPHGDGRRSKTLEYASVDIAQASARMDIPVLIGMKEDGKPLVVDLARLPHLLVSGITGSGKTAFLSSMLYGFLKRFTPEEMRLALYDEKCVEFTPWLGSPYLYRPVVTDAKKVLEVLKDLASEMKRRFNILSAARCRNVQDYNTAPSFSPAPKREKMPYIVFIADEIAELMANEGKRALPIISQLTSMGRAAGIHLVLATSRPAREVVPAQLKANIPGRIAFKMFNGIDSRQIINASGAQNLSGRGDLLFTKDEADWIRAQGAWVSDALLCKELERHAAEMDEHGAATAFSEPKRFPDDYLKAVEYIREKGAVSISMLQRGLGFGYNHAAAIVEKMEAEGLVAPQDGMNPRTIHWDKFPSAK